MPIDEHLIAAIAREMHGRTDIDEATLKETAARVASLLARVRLADERRLQQVAPAFSFDPGAPSYRTPPQQGPAVWQGIAQSAGGTGYGGTAGTPGVSVPQPPTPTDAQATSGPDFLWWPAVELAAAIRQKNLSPVEVTCAFLDRIESQNRSLNAFVTIMGEEAMAAARAAEAAKEPCGPLHGVPLALKDLIDVAGHRTTAGSRLLAANVAQQDATVVTRLKGAGAIIIGKTATHEFAFGSTSDSPFHGPVRNPWNLEMIPAGSSGGSGAAVAAGLVPIAMGSDTGGSIRMPASHCGVVGLKPTYGRVSKAGVIPLSWSLDHVGPLAASVADAATVLGIIAGADPLDQAALPVPVGAYAAAAASPGDLKGVRIGLPVAWLDGPIDAEVRACFDRAVERLRDLGAQIEPVELPPVDVMAFVNRLITFGEVGAYHAPFLKERAADYAPDVRLRMELGQFISARDYLVGQRLRAELARQMHQVMAQVDALVTPVMPIPPSRIGQAMWEYGDGQREPVVEAMIRFCAPISVTGQPAFSLPAGFTANGLPVGLQLIGRVFEEAALIRIAAAFEATQPRIPRR
jgi:aspartyl-tRNA(Asn)/glutamyl-tRNA(Gln) amidotransferase subunit A